MIYLDNGATSFPKPEDVVDSMVDAMTRYCANPGRSGHSMAVKTAGEVSKVRQEIARLIGTENPGRIIFTKNCTESLNLAMKGILREGDHVVTTSMEHNAVMRPLEGLKRKGVETTVVKCAADGSLSMEDVRKAIRPDTKMIVMTAASNVTGTKMPIEETGRLALRHGVIFLVDGAQALGHMELDVEKCHIDMLAAPGHKGLLGPEGTGFLYVREGLALKPMNEGGTGSHSKDLTQPVDFPDGYEAGTVNAPGLIGLGASVRLLNKIGVKAVEAHERKLIAVFQQELSDISCYDDTRNDRKVETRTVETAAGDAYGREKHSRDIRRCAAVFFYGPEDPAAKVGIAALNIIGVDCEEAAAILNDRYGIAVRAGFHCSGMAHETIGTAGTGCIRICPGIYSTEKDMHIAAGAIREIAELTAGRG